MSLLKVNEIQIFNGETVTITAPAVVTANDNTNAALRITQTGTGNALVVEDSSPDSTPVVVDKAGNLVSGASSAIPVAVHNATNNYNPKILAHGADGLSGSAIGVVSNSSTSSSNNIGGNISFNISRNDTAGQHTICNNGDYIGTVMFGGSDGTKFIRSAEIYGVIDGTPSANDMPGRLVFSTTADGASTPTERMRIDSAGNVGIGTSSPAQKLDVTGNINATGALTLGTALAVAEGGTGVTSLGSLDVADLGSGAATDGYVLTADGAGGAAWEAASGGGGGTTAYLEHSSAISDSFTVSSGTNRMYIGGTTFSGTISVAGRLAIVAGPANFTGTINVTGTLTIME